MSDPEALVTVYRAANPTEAHLVKNILDEEGVEASVIEENEPLMGLDFTGPEILVHRKDQDRAEKIIAQYEEMQIERVESGEDEEEEEDES
ncbi:MAG TPA: DUF2007 domain-containing protein [Pirellulales bacterium]|jgi:hypothetical protein|nr:DUF2007 domain-containing protein [Pirellulales bacterium]